MEAPADVHVQEQIGYPQFRVLENSRYLRPGKSNINQLSKNK